MKSTITVHATMTSPQKPVSVAELDRLDRARGFSRIGYHFIISPDGGVVAGRGENESSVHDELALAYHAISICLVGGVDEVGNPISNFTDEQKDAFHGLVRQLQRKHPLLISLGSSGTTTKSVNPAVSNEELNRWVG